MKRFLGSPTCYCCWGRHQSTCHCWGRHLSNCHGCCALSCVWSWRDSKLYEKQRFWWSDKSDNCQIR